MQHKTTHHHAVRHIPERYDASDFISALSLAMVRLEHGGAPADVRDNIEVVEKYTAQKHAKPLQLTVAVLEYKSGSGRKYKTLVPLRKDDFSALSDIMPELGGLTYTPSDIRVMNVIVAARPRLTLKDNDAITLLEALKARQKTMLAGAVKLPPLDEARWQLALLRFFMDTKQKESAYLCADNAKRLLATATHVKGAIGVDDQMAQELNDLEGRLREEMPY